MKSESLWFYLRKRNRQEDFCPSELGKEGGMSPAGGGAGGGIQYVLFSKVF